MFKCAILSITVLLTACGGGGSSPTDGNGSNSVNSTLTSGDGNFISGPSTPEAPTASIPFFSEIANPIQISGVLTDSVMSINANTIDINRDGKDDLIVHFFSNSNYGKSGLGNIQCTNYIKIFIRQNTGSFVDQTDTYIPGSKDLGGCSRKSKVADFNGDGRLDITFAINQEDGRISTDVTDSNAQLAVLVSNGSIYEVKKFNNPNWYHSVGFGYDSNNKAFIAGNGYVGSVDSSGGFSASHDNTISASSQNIPWISPGTFEFFNASGTNAESTFLLEDGQYPKVGVIQGYAKDSRNNWTALADYNPVQVVGYEDTIGYNGQSQGQQPVSSIGGRFIAFGGFVETCKFKMTPTSPTTIIFKYSGSEIVNYAPGTTIRQLDFKPMTKLISVSIVNNQIVPVSLNIDHEQVTDVNSNFFDCKDINGDGYMDIIVYPYNKTGLPYVYLNNKQNGFTYAGQSMFPTTSLTWGNSASSILHDFDKDGIPDLFIWPANGITSSTVTYKYYKGQKLFQ